MEGQGFFLCQGIFPWQPIESGQDTVQLALGRKEVLIDALHLLIGEPLNFFDDLTRIHVRNLPSAAVPEKHEISPGAVPSHAPAPRVAYHHRARSAGMLPAYHGRKSKPAPCRRSGPSPSRRPPTLFSGRANLFQAVVEILVEGEGDHSGVCGERCAPGQQTGADTLGVARLENNKRRKNQDNRNCSGPLNGRRSVFEHLVDFERPVSPHPGPLPRGEGESSSVGRGIQRCKNVREPAHGHRLSLGERACHYPDLLRVYFS